MGRILVTGVTGLFGGEIARQLVAMEVPIRILVRDVTRAPALGGDVEIAVGDFTMPESLEKACQGIDKLFLASYDVPEIAEHQANVLAAARHAEEKHVVRLSSADLDQFPDMPIFEWHRACERQLKASGLAFTNLQPYWVMQNFESFVVNDEIRVPAGNGISAFVDHRDVSAVGVMALTEPGHKGCNYLLATESLSHHEIAAQLSEATGRSITYSAISADTYQSELEADGWAPEMIESMQCPRPNSSLPIH